MKKAIIILLCILLGLAGLFMSACGGFFLIGSLINPRNFFGSGILVIALPSLLAGLACLWGANMGMRKANRITVSEAAPQEPTTPS